MWEGPPTISVYSLCLVRVSAISTSTTVEVEYRKAKWVIFLLVVNFRSLRLNRIKLWNYKEWKTYFSFVFDAELY